MSDVDCQPLPSPEVEPSLDDAQLVRRTAAGSRQAMHELVGRHGQRLYALAYALLGNQADSEDVVQETLIGVFEQAGRFEGRASVKTWITRILVRQVARRHRRERSRRTASLPSDASLSNEKAGTAASDARMDVPRMLAMLSPQQRQVIVLREMEGMSYQQIAETLDIPRGTVESRLFRARAALRNTFTEYVS